MHLIPWPIGSGKGFKGVYDRHNEKVVMFSDTEKGTKEGKSWEIDMQFEDELKEAIGEEAYSTLKDEIELLDGAAAEFDLKKVRDGKLTPVFFGSALTNFGVEIFLNNFLSMSTTPLPRQSDIGIIDPASSTHEIVEQIADFDAKIIRRTRLSGGCYTSCDQQHHRRHKG